MRVPEVLTTFPRPYPVSTKHIGIRQTIEINALTVYTACLWADKRLGAKIRIPGNRNLRESTKNLGDWLYEILNCCERIATLKERAGYSTTPPVERFVDIVNEFYAQGFAACWVSLYPVEDTEYTSYVGKDSLTAKYNEVISSVRKGSENLPQNSAFEVCPEFAGFISDGILFADSNAAFRREKWIPMLKAWRSAVKQMDEKWCLHTITQQSVSAHIGKGRHTRNLTPAYIEHLHQKGFLEPLPGKGYRA